MKHPSYVQGHHSNFIYCYKQKYKDLGVIKILISNILLFKCPDDKTVYRIRSFIRMSLIAVLKCLHVMFQ